MCRGGDASGRLPGGGPGTALRKRAGRGRRDGRLIRSGLGCGGPGTAGVVPYSRAFRALLCVPPRDVQGRTVRAIPTWQSALLVPTTGAARRAGLLD